MATCSTTTTIGSSDLRLRTRRALIHVLRLALIFFFLVVACAVVGIRFNLTESLPERILVVTKDESAQLVEFCPQEAASSISVQRGYRVRGTCPDGDAPLLKPIIARAGDVVEVSSNGITVNGKLLRNSAPRTRDSRGRPLTSWPSGSYVVATGFVWVLSQHHPLSFDSRYYGPVPVSLIRHHLRPLF
jgi:conjugative transfer signal peptidase TraF